MAAPLIAIPFAAEALLALTAATAIIVQQNAKAVAGAIGDGIDAAADGIEDLRRKVSQMMSKSEPKACETCNQEAAKSKEEQLKDMKEKPPDHPDYKPPKKWNGKKVKNPNGSGSGWPDRNGDVWVPTDHNGTHAPHWDVQHPNGTHTPVYPN